MFKSDLIGMVNVVLSRVLEVVLFIGVGAGVDQQGEKLSGARVARRVVNGIPSILWQTIPILRSGL